MRPLHIVVDGLDGAGKTTIIKHIEGIFAKRGLPLVSSKPLGGTQLSQAIRNSVIDTGNKATENLEVLCLAAAHSDTYNSVIGPTLAKGVSVVMDRGVGAFYAYQIKARNNQIAKAIVNVLSRNSDMNEYTIPDVYIYCKVSVDVSNERLSKRGRNFHLDHETVAFKETVLAGYQEYIDSIQRACSHSWVLDCNGTLEQVLREVDYIFNTILITIPLIPTESTSINDYVEFTVSGHRLMKDLNECLASKKYQEAISVANEISNNLVGLIDFLEHGDQK